MTRSRDSIEKSRLLPVAYRPAYVPQLLLPARMNCEQLIDDVHAVTTNRQNLSPARRNTFLLASRSRHATRSTRSVPGKQIPRPHDAGCEQRDGENVASFERDP